MRSSSVVLRPLEEADREMFVALYTSEQVMRHVVAPLSTQAAERSFDRMLDNCRAFPPDHYLWTVGTIEQPAAYGLVTLIPFQHEPSEAEIGILLSPMKRPTGLADEAMRQVAEFAREQLGLKRVIGLVNPGNHAAASLNSRLGFSKQAEQAQVHGQLVDRWLWDLQPQQGKSVA